MTKDTAPSEKSINTPNTEDGKGRDESKRRREVKNPKKDKEKLETKKRDDDLGRAQGKRAVADREIAVTPKPTKEPSPVKSGIFAAVAAKIQEIRDAPNDSRNVNFIFKDRMNFEKVLGGAGFAIEDIVGLHGAELIELTEEAINGRVKGAVVKVLAPKEGEEISPVDRLNTQKVADSGEEDLSVGTIRSRLKPGHGGKFEVGGGATIVDMPSAAAITNPSLRVFVGEIERASDARGEGELLSRLGEIEKELSRAVLEGRLDGADAQVVEVRDKLTAYLDMEIPTYQARVHREQQIEHGQIDFNEHFVGDYKRVKDFIDARDGTSLLDLMRDAKAEVEKVKTLSAAEITDDSKWPADIDVRKVFEVTRALTQEEGLIGRDALQAIVGADPDAVRLLSEFVTPDRDVNLLRRLNSFYQNIYANLSDARKRAIAGDIEDNAQLATGSISQGWREFNPRMKELYDVFERKKLPGAVGALREWRGLTLISGVEENVLYAQLTQPPAHWEDTPVAINKLISAIEPSGLSVQDLQPTLGAAFAMLNRIDQSTSFGRGMYIELKEQIEAFKFKHSLIITAHTKTMDPEALGQVFLNDMEGTAEVTFQAMISRFARDAKGRRFYTERETAGGPLLAAEKEVNLFDVGKRLYSERLRDERIKMNMVEEMTKYSIESPFDAETIKSIKESIGYEYLSDDWKARWEGELEATRKWLVARVAHKTAYNPKFRGKTLDDWGVDGGDLRHGITKAVVQDWYERTTLHGAYGVLGQEDLNEAVAQLMGVFRADGGTDAEVEGRIRKMLGEGPTWIAVRRAEMRQRIKNELKAMGLSYDTSVHYGKHGEHDKLIQLDQQRLDELMESGYIGALEANVYELTWIFEWSTYEFIHIYGKGKSKFDDDYKALVQTRSTDGYWAKIVDHNWEYMHEDFEDRGRGKGEDVNQIFMQHFPGKHHWVFGHVSMAARFIPSFLDKRGNDLVEKRTDELVEQYDFHNEKYEDSFRGYMRGVAIRELILAGAISFADKKYSEVVKERDTFNKFNPVDSADDRKRLKEFVGFGGFQSYLANPEAGKYREMTTKEKIFPSTRDPRLFPWQEFGLKAHWEVVHNYKKKLFDEPDITNEQMERFVETLVGAGAVEKGQGEKFKRKNLGMGAGILSRGFFRDLRGIWEENKRKGQIEGRKRGWALFLLFILWSPIKEFIKSAFTEAKKQ